MSQRVPPNEAQPVVQRLRCCYTKTGRMRFASHRDFQRSLERAVRRAEVPIAYSGGFSPRPRISYANAAPTGTASLAEYIEMGLRERRELPDLMADLNRALPSGFRFATIVEAGPGKLADRLQASLWEFDLRGVSAGEVGDAVDQMLAEPEVLITRVTKSGRKQIDLKSAWVEHDVTPGEATNGSSCAILRLVVRHVTPAVRPDDVLAALVERTDLAAPDSALITRLAQGPLSESTGRPGDPLAQG